MGEELEEDWVVGMHMIKIHSMTFSISNKNTEGMTEKLVGISNDTQFKGKHC